MRVDLLHFPGCPHVEGARAQLRRAFVSSEHSFDGHGSGRVHPPAAPTVFLSYVGIREPSSARERDLAS